jgi:hypothetical protein
MSDYIAGSVQKRREQKDKLRLELAGEDEADRAVGPAVSDRLG